MNMRSWLSNILGELNRLKPNWNRISRLNLAKSSSVTLPFILIMINFGFGQEPLLPENPLKGRIVFEQKGCITCHALKGEGGNIGPDLGKEKFYGSFLQLAGVMWNHSPEMLRRLHALDLPFPEFSRTEMVEVISYLYYLRYLGEPGDLYRGKILLKEKGCLNCHAVGDKGGKVAPAFDQLSKYISPLYLAQALWNHGPKMDSEIEKMGLKRPKFEKGEIVDLSAYIREASKGTDRDRVYMSPGNPQRGKTVFKDKGCLKCHGVKGQGKKIGPELDEMDWDYSATEIAGLMWNHGSEMGKHMEGEGMKWPNFTGREMADLIAYLYFLRFEDKPGDPKEGLVVFSDKGCSSCHGERGTGGEKGPDLSFIAPSSSVDMAQIMWNHTPVMEERIIEGDIDWPNFSGKEMQDLYAFLGTLNKSSQKK
jgi:cytochrome c551/c552